MTFGRKEDPAETHRIQAEKMNELGRELQWSEPAKGTEMTPDELIHELKKLPPGTNIRYLDIDDSDRDPEIGLNWRALDDSSAVGIDWPVTPITGSESSD